MSDLPTQSSRRSFLGLMALLPFAAPLMARPAVVRATKIAASPVIASLDGYAIAKYSVALDPHGCAVGFSLRDPSNPFSDLVFGPLPPAESASAAVSASMPPKVEADAAAPQFELSDVESSSSERVTVASEVAPDLLGAAVTSVSLPTLQGVASAPAGLASAGSALSFGLVDRSDCIGEHDDAVVDAIEKLEAAGFFVIEMKKTTLRTSASTSTKPSHISNL